MRTLRFTNSDARPKISEVTVSSDSIKKIMSWYGAYHSFDRYKVEIDGLEVAKDTNGEIIGEVPTETKV